MFLKEYLFLNYFLVYGIVFCSSYGTPKNLKYRKEIYENYGSFNKFKGEWKDPYISVEIYDDDDKLVHQKYSYNIHSEEIISDQDGFKESWEKPESFPGGRLLPKTTLRDSLDIDGDFLNENRTIFSMSRNLVTVSSILCLLVVILFLLFPKTLIFLFVMILSVLWHWMKLYQEKMAEKQNLTENLRHPSECRRSDLHWYEAIYLYFSSYVSSETDCKAYYKAQLVDPFWEVSFPVAVMNAFTSTICEPLKVLATTVRFCLEVIFSGLTLLQLSIALISFFFILLMRCRYSFSFCWGVFSIHPSRILSVDQLTSESVSSWGSIIKCLRDLFWKAEPLILPPDSSVHFVYKKDALTNKNGDVNVLRKADQFQKQGKSTKSVHQNSALPSAVLNFEKYNYKRDAFKISQFKKCQKVIFILIHYMIPVEVFKKHIILIHRLFSIRTFLRGESLKYFKLREQTSSIN